MKNVLKSVLFFALFALFLFPSIIQAQSIQKEIEAFVANYVERYNQADATSLSELFVKDAIMIQTDNQRMSGTKAIEGYHQQFFAAMNAKSQIETEDIIELPGNYAFTIGAYTLDLKVKANGQKMKVEGNFSALAQKVKQEWKLVRLMLMVPTPPRS